MPDRTDTSFDSLFDEAAPEPAAPAAATADDVQAFALGRSSEPAAMRLTGLERMGERLARRLRQLIEPLARMKAQVAAEPVETLRFEAWRGGLPNFTSLSHYRVPPLRNGILIAIEPDFVARLIDAFYGGAGKGAKAKGREFTPAEDRLLARLTDGVVGELAEVWREVTPLAPVLAARETNAAYASLVRADDAVVVQRFAVQPGTMKPATIAIVYPLAALRPFQAQLAAKVRDEGAQADGEWRGRLAAALQDVRLPVRSVLARPELSVAAVMQLKPGDVIPITLAPRVPLIVADRKVAFGTIGERDGRAALMVEQVGGQG